MVGGIDGGGVDLDGGSSYSFLLLLIDFFGWSDFSI